MPLEIEVNGQIITARKGDYLLDVLQQNGIRIPTLCSLEGFAPSGACRLCVVEIEGKPDLVPACSYPVEQFIKVATHSSRVIIARKTIVELLLSKHPDDCLYCFQSKHCELQRLAHELNVTERKKRNGLSNFKIDRTSQALMHEPAKCVLCGRCILICDDQQVFALEFIGRGSELHVGTAGDRGLAHTNCIACGQCIQACPTGSLSEKRQLDELFVHLQSNKRKVIGLIDPAIMVSLGEELGFRSGKDLSGLLLSGLRKMGFAQVHSGSEMIDFSLFLTAREWLDRLKKGWTKGFISFCPSWMKYLEKLRPDLLPYVLPIQSPAQIFGRIIKSHDPDAYVVYLSPCIAAKTESREPINTINGKPYVDGVVSTRELLQLIHLYGIDFDKISPEVPDTLVNGVRMSGLLSSVSGGYLEGLARALWVMEPDHYPLQKKISRFRGVKVCKVSQMDDFSPVQKWTACSSLSTVFDLIDRPGQKQVPEIFEIMACQGGCINGGGQPGLRNERTTKSRIKEIYDSDGDISGLVNDFARAVFDRADQMESLKMNDKEI